MQLLYFSPVHWHSYAQRPHYMIRYFLNKNPENKVLWIDPYPTRFPRWRDASSLFTRLTKKGIVIIPPLFKGGDRSETITPFAFPIEPMPHSEKINYFLCWKKHWQKIETFCNDNTITGVGRPSKFALLALHKLKHQHSFYDAMDDFPEFYRGFSRRSMQTVEQKIAHKVEKIFVSSTHLAYKFPQAIKILNGYDMPSLPPLPLAKKNNKTIFGFVGTIGQWFDWSIVIKLAKQFPHDLIRLVGPHYVKCPDNLPKNIELFPECSQSEAIQYISQFTIGLIPFKQNALTQGVDPIKFYEYHAMGLPVLTTRFGEMNNHAKTEEGIFFIEEIEKAFSYKASDKQITAFREKNDWKTRFSACGF